MNSACPLLRITFVHLLFLVQSPQERGPDCSLRGRGSEGGGGAVGGIPPPPGDPGLLEAPKAPNKFEVIFWPKLTCAEGARKNFLIGQRPGENFAQSLKGVGGGGDVTHPPPQEMLSCQAKL